MKVQVCCCHNWFYYEFVVVLVLFHPCRALYIFIVDTKKDENKSNFIFPIGSGIYGWTSNPSALYVYGFIHACAIEFKNSWWGRICFLGVPLMLLINMYILYEFLSMTPTSQKKCTAASSCSLPQNLSYSSSSAYQICKHLTFRYFICCCSSCIEITIF